MLESGLTESAQRARRMRLTVQPVRLSSAADDEEFLEIQLRSPSASDDVRATSESGASAVFVAASSDSSIATSSSVVTSAAFKEKADTEDTEKLSLARTGEPDTVQQLTLENPQEPQPEEVKQSNENKQNVAQSEENSAELKEDADVALSPEADLNELLDGEERFSWQGDHLVSGTDNTDVGKGQLTLSMSDGFSTDTHPAGDDVTVAPERAQVTRTDSVGSRASQASFASVASDIGAVWLSIISRDIHYQKSYVFRRRLHQPQISHHDDVGGKCRRRPSRSPTGATTGCSRCAIRTTPCLCDVMGL